MRSFRIMQCFLRKLLPRVVQQRALGDVAVKLRAGAHVDGLHRRPLDHEWLAPPPDHKISLEVRNPNLKCTPISRIKRLMI